MCAFAQKYDLWPEGGEWTFSTELRLLLADVTGFDDHVLTGVKKLVWSLELYSVDLILAVCNLHTMEQIIGSVTKDSKQLRVEWTRHFCNGMEIPTVPTDLFISSTRLVKSVSDAKSRSGRPSSQEWRNTLSSGLCPTNSHKRCYCASAASAHTAIGGVVGSEWKHHSDDDIWALLTSIIMQSQQVPRLVITPVNPHT